MSQGETRSSSSDSVPDGTRSVTYELYGVQRTHRVLPSEYRCQAVADQLADAFVIVGQELAGRVGELGTGIRNLLRFLDRNGFPSDGHLADVTLPVLNRWELNLRQRQLEERTDSAYRYVVHVFALLRRIEQDSPGTLHPEVVTRLESTTRLPHIRRPGDPEFTVGEVRGLRSAAHRLVFRALSADPKADAPSADVLIALHILWSLGTGEPPEVIRGVGCPDVIATCDVEVDVLTDGMSHEERLAYLAERGLVEDYVVTFRKARAGQAYERIFTRAHRSAHKAITATIVLTAGARRNTNETGLWLVAAGAGYRRMDWRSQRSLGAWIADFVRDREISEPHVYRRLRKTVTTREALENPTRYLRDGQRHSARTFFDHYTNSQVLRASAGRILVHAIDEAFNAAVTGPTIIPPDAEELLLRQGEVPGVLDADTVEALEAGQLETPMASCRDPLGSPHGIQGHACPVSTTGDCFACPNALVLRRHLPAVIRLAELTAPERAADPEIWAARWRTIHETVTQAILPAFPEADVEAARPEATNVLLDPTLINDLGVPE